MKLGKLGLLMTFVLVTIAMSINVNAAACNPNSCTPTCVWTYPSSDNFDLVANTLDDNNTMVAAIEEGTTSGFNNITMFTISPYRNGTTTQNTSQFGTDVIYADLDDGTYKLDAIIFYDNFTDYTYSNHTLNLTTTEVACSSRWFTVDTGKVGYIPQVEVDGAIETPKETSTKTILIGVAVFLVLFGIYQSNKK